MICSKGILTVWTSLHMNCTVLFKHGFEKNNGEEYLQLRFWHSNNLTCLDNDGYYKIIPVSIISLSDYIHVEHISNSVVLWFVTEHVIIQYKSKSNDMYKTTLLPEGSEHP